MTKEQIEKLMQGATKGPWRTGRTDMQSFDWEGRPFTNVYSDDESMNRCARHHVTGEVLPHTIAQVMDEAGRNRSDARFIAALPDIAQTALDALQRVEDLERAYQDVHRKKEYWRDEAWDCEHCFHGEDGSGDCALCHGNEPPNQCAYCKANAE